MKRYTNILVLGLPLLLAAIISPAMADPENPLECVNIVKPSVMYGAKSCGIPTEKLPVSPVGMTATMVGPEYTMAGHKSAVSVTIENTGKVPLLVEVVPSILSPAVCSFTGVETSSGGEVFEDTFLLLPEVDAESMRATLALLDVGDSFEPSHAALMHAININYFLRTHPGVVDETCGVQVDVIPLNGLASGLPERLNHFISILPVTNFVPMGKMHGKGGPFAEDRVVYEAVIEADDPFTKEVEKTLLATSTTVYALNGKAKILYMGVASFNDGADTGDKGLFYFTKDIAGGELVDDGNLPQRLEEPSDGPVSVFATEELTAREEPYTRCYVGQYWDGYSWGSNLDDEIGKCFELKVLDIDTIEGVGLNLKVLMFMLQENLTRELVPVLGEKVGSTTVKEMLSLVGFTYVEVPTGGRLYIDQESYIFLIETYGEPDA